MSEKKTRSVYIHVPFCKSKCNYCSFVSGVDLSKKTEYLFSLLKEIDYYYKGELLETFYIGGGTPSLLEPKDLKKLVSKFEFSQTAEKTIEINPNDVTDEFIKDIKDIGFNRLSIGAQTFDDDILKIIGRRHNSEEIFKAVEISKKAGFDNISIDLIYGLPAQTIKGFNSDLGKIISLKLPHLSLYGLKIEEGCYFFDNMPKLLPTDDEQADMYLMAGELTSAQGINHYEISNFSKKGYESKHNTNYWKCGYYYGFGLSAHGYVDGVRYYNTSDMTQYIESPINHEYGKALSRKEMLEEKIFLGFRLAEGIDKFEINEEFDIDFDKKYKKILDKYLNEGYIIQTKKGYSLNTSKTRNGFLLSNIILSEFID